MLDNNEKGAIICRVPRGSVLFQRFPFTWIFLVKCPLCVEAVTFCFAWLKTRLKTAGGLSAVCPFWHAARPGGEQHEGPAWCCRAAQQRGQAHNGWCLHFSSERTEHGAGEPLIPFLGMVSSKWRTQFKALPNPPALAQPGFGIEWTFP